MGEVEKHFGRRSPATHGGRSSAPAADHTLGLQRLFGVFEHDRVIHAVVTGG